MQAQIQAMQIDLQRAQAASDDAVGELIGLRLRVERAEKDAVDGRAAQRALADAQQRAAAAEEAAEALQEEVELLCRRAEEAELRLEMAVQVAQSAPTAGGRGTADLEASLAEAVQKYEKYASLAEAAQAQLEASEAAAAIAGAERDELAEQLAASEAALRDEVAGKVSSMEQVEAELVAVRMERDALSTQLDALRNSSQVVDHGEELSALLPQSTPPGSWVPRGPSGMPVGPSCGSPQAISVRVLLNQSDDLALWIG